MTFLKTIVHPNIVFEHYSDFEIIKPDQTRLIISFSNNLITSCNKQ